VKPTASEQVLDVRTVFAARRAPQSSARLHLARVVSVLVVVAGLHYLSERWSTVGVTGFFGATFYAVECVAFAVLVVSAVLLARAGHRPHALRGAPFGSLNVFVTVCGEPPEMVERTLLAALAIEYPHQTYLLNDGRLAAMPGWEAIDALAVRYQVPCFTRTDGCRGKAGNLNHALQRTRGEFVATIDADHLASPDLATETLGYFVERRVAFVCTSQLFQTSGGDALNNRESLFYRSLQPAKDADSSAFSCGNGAVYRRAALESVGGFSEWNLVEDLHTSYVLHAAGWRSVYHGSPVTVGLAPQTPSVFLRQRLRWATDSTRLLTRDSPLFKPGLSLMQRLHYLHTTSYYLLAGLQLAFLIGPPLTVFFDVPIFATGAAEQYALAAVPYFAALIAFLAVHGDGRGSLPTVQSALFSAPVYLLAAARAILGIRPDSRPTEKRCQRWFSPILIPQICVFGALGGTLVFTALHGGERSVVAVSWAAAMAFLLAGPLTAVNARPALERLLRGTIRGGIVLIAAFGLAAQPAATSAAAEGSRECDLVREAWADAALTSTARGPSVRPPPSGAYFGISQPDVPVCGETIRNWAAAYRFRPAIVNWFQQWRSGETQFRADWLRAVAAQGAIPMVTWEPWTKPRRGFHDPTQRNARLVRIVAGRDDAYISAWARAAAAYRGPILLRPMQEMNGWWYPWAVGTNGNDASTFVAAWRHIHRIFTRAGAHNVRWVWTVHALPDGRRRLASFYPGAGYVDWVSLTVFNWGTAVGWGKWRNLDELITPTYEALARFDEPLMISEIGTVAQGGNSGAWVSRTMRRLAFGYPRIKAVVWFSFRYSRYADFRLRGRAASALRAALASGHWRKHWTRYPRPEGRDGGAAGSAG
jgi:cellulose synthase (UDP-forming)